MVGQEKPLKGNGQGECHHPFNCVSREPEKWVDIPVIAPRNNPSITSAINLEPMLAGCVLAMLFIMSSFAEMI